MSQNEAVNNEPERHVGSQASERLDALLSSMRVVLDQLHSRNPELHQLWLETQWLQSNLRSDTICLPRQWELIIFQMVRANSALHSHPEAFSIARELAQELREAVRPCE